MIAYFDSECGICLGDIDEGMTDIVYHSEYGWVHADPDECEEDDDEFATW